MAATSYARRGAVMNSESEWLLAHWKGRLYHRAGTLLSKLGDLSLAGRREKLTLDLALAIQNSRPPSDIVRPAWLVEESVFETTINAVVERALLEAQPQNATVKSELAYAQDKLLELNAGLSANITGIYSNDYLSAAVVLYETDPQQYEGLRRRLKEKGARVADWERRVKELARVRSREREIREKEHRATRAALGASAPSIVPPAPEPWPQPVNGDDLLTELREFVRRFVVVTETTLTALTLWIVFTYLIDVVEVSPRLAIQSPVLRCGKTRVIDLLAALTCRPLAASNISPAAIFRTLDQEHPALLIDEADSFARDNEELRGLLNSGHTRGTAFVIRTVKVGEDFVPKRFSTWGAIALAAIGKLHATWMDRSIVVMMKRKSRDVKVEKLRRNSAAQATAIELTRKIARWTSDNLAAIEAARPTMPDVGDDRAEENWEPLIAVADLAGGKWPALSRIAATTLSVGRDSDSSVGEMLLADIRAIFDSAGRDKISSIDLCAALANLESRPWAEYGRSGKSLTQPRLARLLGAFGIAPSTIRLGDTTIKGYTRKAFEDAFSSYLSTDPLFNRNNVTTTGGVWESRDFQGVTEGECYASENGLKSNAERECDGVTVQKQEFKNALDTPRSREPGEEG